MEEEYSFISAIELNSDGSLPKSVKISPVSQNNQLVKGRDGREFLINGEKVAKATNGRALDVVLDCNHGSYAYDGERAAAFGWLKNFRVEGKFLVADLELTDKGQNALQNKHFRYLSPAFQMSSNAEVAYVDSVGLVNRPNLKLPALNSNKNQIKEASMPDESKGAHDELLKKTVEENAGLKAQLAEQEQKTAQLAARLEESQKELRKIAVNYLLDEALKQGKILPAQRNSLEVIGLNNQEQLADLLGAMPVQQNLQDLSVELGPKGAPTEKNSGKVSLNQEQRETARALGISEEEYYIEYVKEAE